ncbi:plastid division2 [Artemisia annua]|uniref:Plastid division2 n=1 Tax=Artemisia annua TaxID=35608 RepID=A0A2U1NCL5_ARTAN|nr:plastid division2 [Artemisia annua]
MNRSTSCYDVAYDHALEGIPNYDKAKPILSSENFSQLLDQSLGNNYDAHQTARMTLASTLCIKEIASDREEERVSPPDFLNFLSTYFRVMQNIITRSLKILYRRIKIRTTKILTRDLIKDLEAKTHKQIVKECGSYITRDLIKDLEAKTHKQIVKECGSYNHKNTRVFEVYHSLKSILHRAFYWNNLGFGLKRTDYMYTEIAFDHEEERVCPPDFLNFLSTYFRVMQSRCVLPNVLTFLWFQALQQQQWYEKEASLAEIDYSRKKLLQKLKAYKGDQLDVIQEATAFASSTVEMENNDLLLPPYPTRLTSSLASEKGNLSQFSLTTKTHQNGGPADPSKGSAEQSKSRNALKGLRQMIGAAAKTVLTVAGFIAVMHLSGFEPRLSGRGGEFKVLGMVQEQGNEERTEITIECPPGKVLVVENGVTRCLVKERVEIPFKSVATIPDFLVETVLVNLVLEILNKDIDFDDQLQSEIFF